MSDYISREAAIKELLDTYEREFPTADGAFDLFAVRIMPRVLRNIPAADVEPVRHGNWNIRLADEMTLCLECSICGRKVDNIDLHHLLEAGEYGEACRRYPYCHCGAKMCLEEDTCEM